MKTYVSLEKIVKREENISQACASMFSSSVKHPISFHVLSFLVCLFISLFAEQIVFSKMDFFLLLLSNINWQEMRKNDFLLYETRWQGLFSIFIIIIIIYMTIAVDRLKTDEGKLIFIINTDWHLGLYVYVVIWQPWARRIFSRLHSTLELRTFRANDNISNRLGILFARRTSMKTVGRTQEETRLLMFVLFVLTVLNTHVRHISSLFLANNIDALFIHYREGRRRKKNETRKRKHGRLDKKEKGGGRTYVCFVAFACSVPCRARALLWRCVGCHKHQEHRRYSPFLASSSIAGSNSSHININSDWEWNREREKHPHPRVCL